MIHISVVAVDLHWFSVVGCYRCCRVCCCADEGTLVTFAAWKIKKMVKVSEQKVLSDCVTMKIE